MVKQTLREKQLEVERTLAMTNTTSTTGMATINTFKLAAMSFIKGAKATIRRNIKRQAEMSSGT